MACVSLDCRSAHAIEGTAAWSTRQTLFESLSSMMSVGGDELSSHGAVREAEEQLITGQLITDFAEPNM